MYPGLLVTGCPKVAPQGRRCSHSACLELGSHVLLIITELHLAPSSEMLTNPGPRHPKLSLLVTNDSVTLSFSILNPISVVTVLCYRQSGRQGGELQKEFVWIEETLRRLENQI